MAAEEESELDRAAVTALADDFLLAMKRHYERRPTARASAQEVLNAAAIVVAVVIFAARECGDEEGARDFFDGALEMQLEKGT